MNWLTTQTIIDSDKRDRREPSAHLITAPTIRCGISFRLIAAAALFALSVTACATAAIPTPFPTAAARPTQAATSRPDSADGTPTAAFKTATPDPYAGLTILDLRTRSYGGGEIEFAAEERVSASFSRYRMDYPSDGLSVHGFVNVPRGEGPYPVVLVLHGYIDPEEYETLAYTTRYADALAAEGYVVFHPNYRNYAPSDSGPNPFRVGYAVDALNLIALIEEQAGRPGPLKDADPSAIGLFGHSMGGGISLRLITAHAPIQAAVLYGSMNADEHLNFEKIYEWSEGEDEIGAAVSLHHGEDDDLVPPEWSQDLCERLTALEKMVECFSYPNEPHTFIGFGGIQLIERAAAFYEKYLGTQ